MARKLKSNRGASLIVALLVFLICAMVGAVVVAAASAGIQHVQERHEEQQEYFSLSSASKVLTEGMRNLKFTSAQGVKKLKGPFESGSRISIGGYLYPSAVFSNKNNLGTAVINKGQSYANFKDTIYSEDMTGNPFGPDYQLAVADDNQSASALESSIGALCNAVTAYNTAHADGDPHVETAEMTIIPDAQKSTFPVNVAIQMSRDYSVIMTLTIKSDSETHYVPFVLSLSAETYESAEPIYTQLDEYESLRQFDLIIGNGKNLKYKISSKVSQKFYYEKVTEEYTEVSWHYSSLNKGSE